MTIRSPARALRRIVKRGVFAIAWLVLSPAIVLCWVESKTSPGERLYTVVAQGLAVLPGELGVRLRAAFYFGTVDRCDWETHFGFGTVITHRGASIADRVSTGLYCVIGHVTIGEGAMIGSRVSIPSGKRQHLDDHGRLAETTRFDRVQIGARCWIGEGAIIVADVGARCIVSAGAVVVDPVPESTLVAGNPARRLRAVEVSDDPRPERS